ncbi:uncharacterized protein LOC141685385 [Apium graveolens]|uniref:uncharacterized protein LOC141685385 n=1 Tax=Apium graveolens TaxID=4045 RepID=UPI003D795B85
MSVTEYEPKFTELSRFVPEQVYIEEKRAKRFQQGLKPWIHSGVAVFELTTYTAVVQKAMIIEGESEMSQNEKEQGNFQNPFNRKPRFQARTNTNLKRSEQDNQRTGNHFHAPNQQKIIRPLLPYCKTCGQKHTDVHNKASVTCFRKKGHIARDCREPTMAASVPRVLALLPPPEQNQPKARTFNMIMKEAVQNPSIVVGTLSVNSVDAKILIDSGSTRYLISEEFINKICCEIQWLGETLIIKLANDDQVPVDRVCPECDVVIAGRHFSVDLIPLKLEEFDFILGIDWLASHNTEIDYGNKKVKLRTADNETVIFRGEKQR